MIDLKRSKDIPNDKIMKKILFILHIPPPVHGSSIVGLAVKNSSIINNSFDCRYINLLVSRTMIESGKPNMMKIFRFVGLWFRLLYEVIKDKPDVCYLAVTASGVAFYKDVLLVALLRLFRIKRVYHLHNQGVRQNQNKGLNSLFYSFVFKNADVLLLSNQLYDDVKTFVPISRVHICPNGIVDTTSINIKPSSFEVNKPVKILFLSNLLELKGIYVLLDACSVLQQRGIDFECDFIGAEGDLNAAIFNEKVIQKQLFPKVNYLGKKFGKEKEVMFANADIFVHPTLNDCFPLVLLEAMQYSLPVVSTYEGGIPDIIDDGITGFLVPKKNVEALVEKIEVLIKNPHLRQMMGTSGRMKYEREFTINKFEIRLNEILKQVTV